LHNDKALLKFADLIHVKSESCCTVILGYSAIIPTLVDRLQDHKKILSKDSLQTLLAVLARLTRDESGSKAFSGQSALIPTLAGLLQEPLNEDSLQSLLAVVANLAAAESGWNAILRDSSLIPALVGLLHQSLNEDSLQSLLAALAWLAYDEKACSEIAKPDIVKVLVNTLNHGEDGVKANAAAALGIIANHESGRSAILGDSAFIPALVGLFHKSLNKDALQSLLVALALLAYDEKACNEIVRPDIVNILVNTLSHDEDDIKSNAAMALGIFATHESGRNVVLANPSVVSTLLGLVWGNEGSLPSILFVLGEVSQNENACREVAQSESVKDLVCRLSHHDDGTIQKNAALLLDRIENHGRTPNVKPQDGDEDLEIEVPVLN